MSNDPKQLRCPDCGGEVVEDCGKHYVKYSCGRKHYHGRIKDIRTIDCYERKERQLREAIWALISECLDGTINSWGDWYKCTFCGSEGEVLDGLDHEDWCPIYAATQALNGGGND